MKKKYFAARFAAFISLCLVLALGYFSPAVRAVVTLPNTIYIGAGGERVLLGLDQGNITISGGAAQVRQSGDETLQEAAGVRVESLREGSSTATLSILGVPVRSIELRVAGEYTLIPGGQAVGIRLFMRGVLVVGVSNVSSAAGEIQSPAKAAGLSPGDIILEVDGTEVQDSNHLGDLVSASEGDVLLTVERNGRSHTVSVRPQTDAADGQKKLGIWARDSTAGVGTITYYDPSNYSFGALGHPITDVDTGGLLSVKQGEIVDAEIVGIVKGERGTPGELKGMFSSSQGKGRINVNTDYGVFGFTSAIPINPIYPNGVEIGARTEVKTGEAFILSTIDGTGIKAYSCNVVRINTQNSPGARGMVVEITDAGLLQKTGGIVQGMSGSPIIQNGKIIGAVTHVFVNDPTKGYAMYIEWMIQNTENAAAAA